MKLEEMQARLEKLCSDRVQYERNAQIMSQQAVMLQGHINELSFFIEQLKEKEVENIEADIESSE